MQTKDEFMNTEKDLVHII